MKYLLTIDPTTETQAKMLETPEETKKGIAALIEQAKPEAMYFSTIRRRMFVVVNVDDPHCELRVLFESFAKLGTVTVDPVSTFEEFNPFMEQLLGST